MQPVTTDGDRKWFGENKCLQILFCCWLTLRPCFLPSVRAQTTRAAGSTLLLFKSERKRIWKKPLPSRYTESDPTSRQRVHSVGLLGFTFKLCSYWELCSSVAPPPRTTRSKETRLVQYNSNCITQHSRVMYNDRVVVLVVVPVLLL